MKEKLFIFVSWRVPKRLAYWCAVRVFSYATTGEYSGEVVPEVTAMAALERWPE